MNEPVGTNDERLRMWSLEKAVALSHQGTDVSSVVKTASAIEDYVVNGENTVGELRSKVEFALKDAFAQHVPQVEDAKRDRVLGELFKSLKNLGVVGDI